LLSGDALLTVELGTLWGVLSFVLGIQAPYPCAPPRYTSWDDAAAAATFASLWRLRPRVLGPGHGRPWLANEVKRARVA
jgi:hypothetical protein